MQRQTPFRKGATTLPKLKSKNTPPKRQTKLTPSRNSHNNRVNIIQSTNTSIHSLSSPSYPSRAHFISPNAFSATTPQHAPKKAPKGDNIDLISDGEPTMPIITKKRTRAPAASKNQSKNQNLKPQLPTSMTLTLNLTDPEVIAFLHEANIDPTRDYAQNQLDLANNALKIGVLALKSAQSKVDVHTIHTEIDRMMGLLQTNLAMHNHAVNDSIQTRLKEYFDPSSGRFEERIKRLLHKDDGELASLIKQQVVKTSTTLSDNLTPLIGPGSRLLTILDPDNKTGLVSLVQWAVGEANKSILAEFSLDNKNGSLRRLISELREVSAEGTTANIEYLKELSLDNPKSALNRLIQTIEIGQREQLKQMNLDSQDSPISRLKLDIVSILNKQQDQLNSMEQLCLKEFSTLNTSKNIYDKLAKRTPLHGLDFEQKLFSFVQALMSGVKPDVSSNNGIPIPIGSYSSSDHIVTQCGGFTGNIRNCKVGDILITMGPEHVSAGAKIVIEAKADNSYNIAKALEEIGVAKRNRGADVGVFVFAKKSQLNPDGTPSSDSSNINNIENLKRYGNDVVVLWDPEDPHTNIFVDAALSISKALLIRKQQSLQQTNNAVHQLDSNLVAMNNIIIDLEKEVVLYDEIKKFSETIHSSTEKMLHRLKNSGSRVIDSISKLNQVVKQSKQLTLSLNSPQDENGNAQNY
jgi:hypothetical protein